MKVAIHSYSGGNLIPHEHNDKIDNEKAQLVLAFGSKQILTGDNVYSRLRAIYPGAEIVLCSTSGEIFDDRVMDNTVSITAIEFEHTQVRTAMVDIGDYKKDSYAAGMALAGRFELRPDLCYLMVISDGGEVNGSELVKGVDQVLKHRVPVTGGLAGDGTDFISTVVGLNEEAVPGRIAAIALYSDRLVVTHGTMGGWETFGPERTVTKSEANRLFEINQENALDVYTKYLGTYAEGLPGSALLFPLAVKLSPDGAPVVRTILSIDQDSRSMVFAGDIPEGTQVRFMKANFDKLIEAAGDAARQTLVMDGDEMPQLALLISCVGRKIILAGRTEEEVEAVRDIFGHKCMVTGFYSYGEISPFKPDTCCELHNQTMTITTFNEKSTAP